MRRIGEEEEQQPQSTALRFSLYKYVNTCKLVSSRSHHCRQKREKKRERIREKLLCIVFSSSYSEIINNIDRAPGYIYIYTRASLYTPEFSYLPAKKGKERRQIHQLIIYFTRGDEQGPWPERRR